VNLIVDDRAVAGEPFTIEWSVERADRAFLSINGSMEEIPPEQFNGMRVLVPDRDLDVRLEARNRSAPTPGPESIRQKSVAVLMPTPTPIGTPAIFFFDVRPINVMVGQPVELRWSVGNVDSVSIDNFRDNLLPEGSLQWFPEQPAVSAFTLRARNDEGFASSEEIRVVVAPLPTGTPVPLAPIIDKFEVIPEKAPVLGDTTNFLLSWAVQGEVTSLKISSPDLPRDLQLTVPQSRTGTIRIPVVPQQMASFFELSAANKDLLSAKLANIAVEAPTPVPPTPLPPPPTATPVPPPVIVFFGADSADTPPRPDEVQLVRDSEYTVLVGGLVKLSWSTASATRVELVAVQADNTQVNYGNRPVNADFSFKYDGKIRHFDLFAYNEPNGAATNPSPQSQRITINAREIIPTAPFNLAGSVQGGKNVLTWSYDSQLLPVVKTFRVWRTATISGNLLPVADIPAPTTNWVDESAQPNCGFAYFVVATYLNVDGVTKETPPSLSWFSPVCE
jgi:hypothetical protein